MKKNEHGLIGWEEAFAAGVSTGMQLTDAYRKARPEVASWKPETVRKRAHETAHRPEVKARIDALLALAAKASEATVQSVQEEMRTLTFADVRELMELRRVCCRYCWGKGFRYQRTPQEMRAARAGHAAQRALARSGKAPSPGPFSEEGGDGFSTKRGPNPDCPECHGEGEVHPFFKDTRNLTPAAARLFAGVKVTDKGLEVKLRDQDAALDRLARMLGAYEKDNRQRTDPLAQLLQTLGGKVIGPNPEGGSA